jgi:transcriptional regulator with XRE-family HTH domain
VKHSIKVAVLVRSLRNAFCLSQDALAIRAGCSRPTVNRLETFSDKSTRSDTVDGVLDCFKQLGVEINILDESLEVCFTKKALKIAESNMTLAASTKKI